MAMELEGTPAFDSAWGRTFRGFGTTVGVWATNPTIVDRLEGMLRLWVDRVEAVASRFREDSDISRANAAAGSPVAVSRELLRAVDAACRMADATLGLCDPTVGNAVIGAGYDRSFELVEAAGPGPRQPPRPGGAWRRVVVDHGTATLTVPEGCRRGLGGSAQGWAVDSFLARLRLGILYANPDLGVCVSAGGDLAVAGRPPGAGWTVTVQERLDGDDPDAEDLLLTRGAMATSGATARRWGSGVSAGHHVVDPRTGTPGRSCWRLVTVFSSSCLVADTAATAAWLLAEDAPHWLAEQGLAARLVHEGGRAVYVGDVDRWVRPEAQA
ncbi:MAG: FAD:protein transferase [Chloroflexota bacterium]|nr:FAD:protein transferase [Chloroflexota bacterium]